MIFGTILHQKLDSFFSNFRTKQGILRSIRSRIRKEIQEEESARKEIAQAVSAVQEQKEDALVKALTKNGSTLKQGYFRIREDQMHRIFEGLHLILREDQKLYDQLKDLEYALARDETLQEGPKKIIAHAINTCITIVEQGANQIIRDIEGMQSLTISGFKLLERESQMREIIGEVLKGRQPMRAFEKEGQNALKQIHRLENPTPQDLQDLRIFDMEHNNHSIQAQLTLAVQELMIITDELIMLLNEIYQDFLRQWHSEQGKGKRITEITDEAPSVKTLGLPTTEGGFGLGQERVTEIDVVCKHIDEEFKAECKRIEGEARIYLSIGEHMKLRE